VCHVAAAPPRLLTSARAFIAASQISVHADGSAEDEYTVAFHLCSSVRPSVDVKVGAGGGRTLLQSCQMPIWLLTAYVLAARTLIPPPFRSPIDSHGGDERGRRLLGRWPFGAAFYLRQHVCLLLHRCMRVGMGALQQACLVRLPPAPGCGRDCTPLASSLISIPDRIGRICSASIT